MVLESKYLKFSAVWVSGWEVKRRLSLNPLVNNGDRVDSKLSNAAHLAGHARAAVFKENES